MNISAIKGFSVSNPAKAGLKSNFKGNENSAPANDAYYNPVNPKTEKKLAVLSSVGSSAVVGAVVAGLTSFLKEDTKLLSRVPLLAGAAAGLVALALTLPSALYRTNVNATVREKEMDIFTRDAELQKDLTQEVHQEVKDPEVSLDQKLAHNVQLQLANKAAMVGFKTF